MPTLPIEAALALPHVFGLSPVSAKTFALATRLKTRQATTLLSKYVEAGILARTFSGFHFAAQAVQLHWHSPDCPNHCSLAIDQPKILTLPGDMPYKCQMLGDWRDGVDAKQIKALKSVLKVHARDRKEIEHRFERQPTEVVQALVRAYLTARRRVHPDYEVVGSHYDIIATAASKLVAHKIERQDFKKYVDFVFECFALFVQSVDHPPPKALGYDYFIDRFWTEHRGVLKLDPESAANHLRQRDYKGPIDPVLHLAGRLRQGHAMPEGPTEAMKEAALWLVANAQLVGTVEVK